MKITRQGKIPEEVSKAGRCSHCNTEFEYVQADVRVKDEFLLSRDPREHPYSYVICPLCHKEIGVSKYYP
jgi:hypothetical protein